MFFLQKRPPQTVILEHWHQNWKEWIDGKTDRLVMEAGGRDITPFSDWFSMTPQLYNRPFSCFNFPFSWSLTSLCKKHHHTHLLPQMLEVLAQYFLGGSKCFEMLRPNLLIIGVIIWRYGKWKSPARVLQIAYELLRLVTKPPGRWRHSNAAPQSGFHLSSNGLFHHHN